MFIVDPDLHDAVHALKWSVITRKNGSRYVMRSYWQDGAVRTQTLANYVKGGPAPAGMIWTHANGNPMDYRRENLIAAKRGHHLTPEVRQKAMKTNRERLNDPNRNPRVARSRNMMGVQPVGERWRMRFKPSGQKSVTSMHDTEEEAARAYDRARLNAGLEPANFPEAEYRIPE